TAGGDRMAAFPPYRLIQRDFLAEAQEKHARLERLYHVTHKNAWDGREVLKMLLDKHGGVKQIPAERKAAIARVFSIILWGEPALSELMPYFERDEARHVGLGVLYLPGHLSKLSRLEAMRLQVFQVKINTFIVWGTILLRDSFEALGIDLHDVFVHSVKSQL